MRAGAALSNMREAWWIPVGEVPKDSNPTGKVLVNGQRTLPHSIMVNKRGRRFTNEAANYNAFGAALHVGGRVEVRVRQPAVLARVRPAVRRPLRLARRLRQREGRRARLAAEGRHAGRAGGAVGRRRRRARRHDRALERQLRRRPRPRLRPRRLRVRLLVGRPAPQRPTRRRPRPAHPGSVLRVPAPLRLPRHERWPAHRPRRTGARPRRSTDRRAVRRRQRDGLALRHDYGGPGGTLGPAMVFSATSPPGTPRTGPDTTLSRADARSHRRWPRRMRRADQRRSHETSTNWPPSGCYASSMATIRPTPTR